MSDIITTAGDFRFINRTRYNSQDIANLFLGRLAAANAGTGSVVTLSRGQRGGDMMLFELGDYKPAVLWEEVSVWNGTANVKHRKANFVNPPGWAVSNNWKLNMVSPERLYENPVEALTAMSEEQPVAPSAFSVELAHAFRYISRLETTNWRDQQDADKAVDAWAATQRIRIMPKRENSLKSDTRQARQNTSAALASINSFLSEVYGSMAGSEGVLTHFSAMVRHNGVVGESVNTTRLQLDEAYAVLRQARDEAAAMKQRLLQAGTE